MVIKVVALDVQFGEDGIVEVDRHAINFVSVDNQYELIENAILGSDDIYIIMLLVCVVFGPVRMTRNVGHLRVFIHEFNLEDAPKAVSVDNRASGYDVLGEWVRCYCADQIYPDPEW